MTTRSQYAKPTEKGPPGRRSSRSLGSAGSGKTTTAFQSVRIVLVDYRLCVNRYLVCLRACAEVRETARKKSVSAIACARRRACVHCFLSDSKSGLRASIFAISAVGTFTTRPTDIELSDFRMSVAARSAPGGYRKPGPRLVSTSYTL